MADGGDARTERTQGEQFGVSELLTLLPQQEFSHFARMATRLLGIPVGAVVLIGRDEKWLLGCAGTAPFKPPPNGTFCDVAVARRATLVVPDTQADSTFAAAAEISGELGIRFYAGTPLIDETGEAIGTLCVFDSQPHPALTADQRATLEDLSQMVMDRIELRTHQIAAEQATTHAASQAEMLRLVLEAADFGSACTAAMEYLRETCGAEYCRLFRLAANGQRVDYIAGAGMGQFNPEATRETMRGLHLTIENSAVGRVIAAGEQIIADDLRIYDPAEYPMISGLLAQGVCSVIATPFSMLDEHHAIALGFTRHHATPAALAAAAALARLGAETLRPMLRRLKDEAESRLFRRAVDCSPDPVLITDAANNDYPGPHIVYCNDAFLLATGYSREEVMGRSPRFLQGPGTDPAALAEIRGAMDRWEPSRNVVQNYSKSGKPYHVELSISPVADHTGWYTHWVSVQRDVTDHQAIEVVREANTREMQAMFQAMPGAMLRFRPSDDGRWLKRFISTSIQSLTGFTPAEAMASGWLRQRVREEDFEELQRHFQIAHDTGSSATEFRFQHPDGKLRLIQSRMCSFDTADGTREVICIWVDVTRERGLTAQLDQASKLAELGEMAAGLAHELNRPLASINLAAENAIRALDHLPATRARVEQKLTTICDLAMRAASVVRHIQLFGRFDSGETRPVALTTLVDDMMILAQAKLMECNVEVLITIPDDLPMLMVRPIPLEQVLINLIANACDAYHGAGEHIPPCERLVWITAQHNSAGVQIEVRDHAGGVPEVALPYLFDAFFTTKSAGKGTGLGLSISSGIVKEMGGTLSVRNDNGGAVFVLDLPADIR